MKKSKEYIPQFSEIDLNHEYYDKQTENDNPIYCPRCKKTVLYLKGGLCDQCSKEVQCVSGTEPNEDLYNDWRDGNIERTEGTFLMTGAAWATLRKYGITGLFIAIGVVHLLLIIPIFFQLGEVEHIQIIVSIFIRLFLSAVNFLIAWLLGNIRYNVRHKRFLALNEKTVYYDASLQWCCPSCKTNNVGNKCCYVCGVLPKLVLKDQQGKPN